MRLAAMLAAVEFLEQLLGFQLCSVRRSFCLRCRRALGADVERVREASTNSVGQTGDWAVRDHGYAKIVASEIAGHSLDFVNSAFHVAEIPACGERDALYVDWATRASLNQHHTLALPLLAEIELQR